MIAVVLIAAALSLIVVVIAALSKRKQLRQRTRPNPRENNAPERELRNSAQVTSPYERNDRGSGRTEEQKGGRATVNPNGTSTNGNEEPDVYSSLLYYVYLDDNTYGPFSLQQLKSYPLLEDTLITTNTLGGIWYEAKYFECLDDLFHPQQAFHINANGEIIRNE